MDNLQNKTRSLISRAGEFCYVHNTLLLKEKEMLSLPTNSSRNIESFIKNIKTHIKESHKLQNSPCK